MKLARISALTAAGLALAAVPAFAQPIVSVQSGVIVYVQGQVYLNDQPVNYSATHFTDIQENAVVRTQDGLAEVLLTPGVVLRLGDHASFRMITRRLIDTRLEMLSGSAVVEADQLDKEHHVAVVAKDGTVSVEKPGIYRFDSSPARLKVFKGEAIVQTGTENTKVTAGKMLSLDGATASVEKFKVEDTDSLDNWSGRRAGYMAMANASAAQSLRSSWGGFSSSLFNGWGSAGCGSAWAFNPYYGMMTFVPCSGYLWSPYGYPFFSPFTANQAYYYVGNYGGGVRTAPTTLRGSSLPIGTSAVGRSSVYSSMPTRSSSAGSPGASSVAGRGPSVGTSVSAGAGGVRGGGASVSGGGHGR